MRARVLAAAFVLAMSNAHVVHAEPPEADAIAKESAGSIEQLLKSGWQVAGYASTYDNRSAMILFRNPSENYLVQCQAGYDVTRSPRVYQNCYRLK